MKLRLSIAFGIVFGLACVASAKSLPTASPIASSTTLGQGGPIPCCRPDLPYCPVGCKSPAPTQKTTKK